MPSVPRFHFRFTPSWIMTGLALVTISLLLKLGFWQIERADEKTALLQKEESMAHAQVIVWNGAPEPLPFQRIRISGQYESEVFLLDNQHQQHQFGYDVLSPLRLADGGLVLVDRGWVVGDSLRQKMPYVEIPHENISLQGSVYYPSDKQWVLGAQTEKKDTHLTILECLDTKLVSQVLQKKVYPFIIRLDQAEKHGFVRRWAIVSMPPQRHIAYAIQWFAMALVVLIIYVALNLKTNEKKIN